MNKEVNFNHKLHLSPSFIKEYFLKSNANIRKSWGQNFLIDPNVLLRITNEILKSYNLIKNEKLNKILEIGPGFGALTFTLLEKTNVTAVEIDPVLIDFLKKINEDDLTNLDQNTNQNLDQNKNQIIDQNTKQNLEVKIDQILDQNNKNNKKEKFLLTLVHLNILDFIKENKNDNFSIIFGNLPYYITTDILISLMQNFNFENGIFLVQKEYAERIKTKNKNNSIGIFLQNFGEWDIHFHVSPNCFYPRPKVFSSLISVKKYKNRKCDPEILEKILRLSYIGRRKKMLTNWKKNLTTFFPNIDLESFIELAKKVNITGDERAEDIKCEQYYELTKLITDLTKVVV